MTRTVTVTQQLSEFTSDVRYADLPPEVAHQSKRLILDSLGCAIGGSQTELGEIALRFATLERGDPVATLISRNELTTAVMAAMANGRMAGALDADDTFATVGLVTHHAAATVAAAFALAERSGQSGKTLITAVAAGYELGARFAIAVPAPVPQSSGGWRFGGGPAGVLAPAAAASHVLQLDGRQAMHALGIAGAHAEVSPLKISDATIVPMVKSLDGGWNAATGTSAALLASLGMTGHADILDGETGLWRGMGYDSFDFNLMVHELGTHWYILDAGFKRWPCQYWMQPALTAYWDILQGHSLEANQIESLTLRTNPRSASGRSKDKHPEGAITCQFSFPHAAAMLTLRVPAGPRWYDNATLADPRVQEFRDKVEVEIEPASVQALDAPRDKIIRRVPASAEVRANGRTYSARVDAGLGAPWSPDSRLDDDGLRAKVVDMAVPLQEQDPMWTRRIREATELVMSLEGVEDVRQLGRMLTLGG